MRVKHKYSYTIVSLMNKLYVPIYVILIPKLLITTTVSPFPLSLITLSDFFLTHEQMFVIAGKYFPIRAWFCVLHHHFHAVRVGYVVQRVRVKVAVHPGLAGYPVDSVAGCVRTAEQNPGH